MPRKYERDAEGRVLCPQCTMTSTTASSLKRHIQSIHEKNTYPCPQCDYEATQVSSLKTHIQSIHDKKTYPCPQCDYEATTSSSLKAHIQSIHDKKTYPCQLCDYKATTSGSLSKHLTCTHGGVLHRPCIGPHDSGSCVDGGKNYSTTGPYGKRCVRCFVSTYVNSKDPDKKAIANNAGRHLHAKELSVRSFLEKTFPQHRWVFDKTFCVGVRNRPDALTKVGRSHMIIVEVDENSHDVYVCAEERERERIFKAHSRGECTIALIRFNPDAYDNIVTGKRVPSCFKTSEVTGSTIVNPKHQKEWEMRLSVLKMWVEHLLEFPPVMRAVSYTHLTLPTSDLV